MAQKIRVELVDDIDGSDATQTVPFALDGVTFEIDLSDDNAERLREEFAPFVAAGRRTGGRKTRSTATASTYNRPTAIDRARSRIIRGWARDNQWPLSDRGRIPVEVQNAYNIEQEEADKATSASQSRSRRRK